VGRRIDLATVAAALITQINQQPIVNRNETKRGLIRRVDRRATRFLERRGR
jgi:hypothetical protein